MKTDSLFKMNSLLKINKLFRKDVEQDFSETRTSPIINLMNKLSYSASNALKLLLACFSVGLVGNVFSDQVKLLNQMWDKEGKKVVFEIYDGPQYINSLTLKGNLYPIVFTDEVKNPILSFRVGNQVICRVKLDQKVRAENRGKPFYFFIKNDRDTGCNFIGSWRRNGDRNLDNKIEYFPKSMPK